MKPNVVDAAYPISILNFLATYKQACDSDEFRKGAVIRCFKHFLIRSIAASLAPKLYLKNKRTSLYPVSVFCSWKEAGNCPLRAYVADDVIVKAEMNMQNYQHLLHMKKTQYAEDLWRKALRSIQVYTN